MPFKPTGKKNDFVSPSGRHYNGAQVRLWYANGRKFPGQKESEPMNPNGYAKGGDIAVASYAQGGPVLGREKDFMKTEDRFRGQGPDGRFVQKDQNKTDEDWAKSGKGEQGKDKVLPTVKPRS